MKAGVSSRGESCHSASTGSMLALQFRFHGINVREPLKGDIGIL